MGVQKGWPDFLLIAPGGRLHALELKRQGEVLSEDQEDFAAWCREQGVPFVYTDDLREAIVTLSGWGALRRAVA
jgi:predicted type IV restriction endonuclease